MPLDSTERRTLDIKTLVRTPNIAELLTDEELRTIAGAAVDGYDQDVQSREEWATRNAASMKLALQVAQRKTEPWDGASNVKFPLVTIAALYYHARAMPLLIDGDTPVSCRVFGDDPKGEKAERADRISRHQSWQLLEQEPEWEEEHDKLQLIVGILGTCYKKKFFDPALGRKRSLCVSPENFVVNYWTTGDVNECPRATYVMELQPNDVRERVVRGIYCDYDDDSTAGHQGAAGIIRTNDDNALGPQREPQTTPMRAARDDRTGARAPQQDHTAPILMLEQMCWLDLDNDDYAEPYYVTVEKDSRRIRRIVARYTESDVKTQTFEGVDTVYKIVPERAYVKYTLIPSPDGSHLGIGFGHLLGPINESVNTAINLIFDGGHMSTLGGGFLGRGARMKGGDNKFKPNEWKNVDVIGGDLAKNIFALPVREPSAILLQLLTYLVGYGERVASANDLQTGENIGQNTPARTAETMNQNGARVFSACFKRQWRAQRDEFRIDFDLNRSYLKLDADYRDLTSGSAPLLLNDDYVKARSTDIRPAADPTVVSEAQKRETAGMVLKLANTLPGFHRYNSTRRFLVAQRVSNIDQIYPRPQAQPGPDGQPIADPDIAPPPDPKMLDLQIKGQKLQNDRMKIQSDLRTRMIELQMQAQKIGAEVLELQARSVMELAQAKGVEQGHQIALIDAKIGAKKNHMDFIVSMIDQLNTTLEGIGDGSGDGGSKSEPSGDGAAGGMAGLADHAGVFSQAAPGSGGAAGGMGAG